ncbi:MAG: DUF2490 domain-containing protein [Bacteroidaceae bacterium]|nr:DUF2490 domain-containing protein [Bacteroidaceae bacterium]
MNTNSRTKSRLAAIMLAATLACTSFSTIDAQDRGDEFGIWATAEFSKKATKNTKFVIDAEVRTIKAVKDAERIAIGAKIDYKIIKWVKANVGYSFIYGHKMSETSIKEEIDAELGYYNKNIDADYWTIRNRVYATISGEYKIGRFEISLRERLQYTHTGSATIDEKKVRYEREGGYKGEWKEKVTVDREFKNAKNDLSLRSRLQVKYDIPKCKITPFASVELYTRLDKWKGYDKLRYRAGGTWKINKKNSISLYYLYQDKSDDDEPSGHAVGVEYSLDI